MRNMSFALTTQQMRAHTKTVTRRIAWLTLKPGDYLQAVVKCQGLKKGERIEKIGILGVLSVRRERLDRLTTDLAYGVEEVCKEGFAEDPRLRWPSEFVAFFCSTHRPCEPSWEVTRIEFEHLGDSE